MTASLQALKGQLQQLKELLDSGVLSKDQYEESKVKLERRILDAVVGDTVAGQVAMATPAARPAAARPSALLLALVASFVLVVSVGGYLWKRSAGPMVAATEQAQGASAAEITAEQQAASDQIAAMVDKLAQRMKELPNDPEGWTMLARSYSVMGRNEDALQAYSKAIALRKDDPALLADYADALAVKNNRSLEGEPIKLVERALKLDPKNLKALSLAGAYAYDRKDYAGAVRQWEKVVQFGPADNAFVAQFGPAIDEARALAGMPPAAKPLDMSSKGPAGAASSVSGRVSLSPALAKLVSPEDTIFVFARPAPGAGMPLAILRKQVKDLPFEFTLDDSMAMSPANALSGASAVVVSARISKSGNAMPQPGDLSGQTAQVNVGAKDLQIEIKDVVKP
jgi:cytochrome c-type biogenesis protein CcmH